MVSVEFILAPAGEDDGGFCVVPGSHKANFLCPPSILAYEEHRDIVRTIAVQPGDVIFFNEAVIHGTLPWTASHQRRALLYRYSPRWLHWYGPYARYSRPAWVEELDEQQQAVMEPPYYYDRPVIEDDGSVVRRTPLPARLDTQPGT
jgi:ectoine hydroxylase-related dioxygenase (phytanoyl-CoA dioxygenase family)